MNNFSPGRGKGHSARPPRMSSPQMPDSAKPCKPCRRTSPARSIARAQRLVNTAAVLAFDTAALAGRTGRGDHAWAALHLVESARHAWAAAEVLAEGACA
jgi:hypothetical protein